MSAGPAAGPVGGRFRDVPYMGVIYVVAEAMKLGFVNGHPDWSNLGQGQPEVGELAGAPPRLSGVQLRPEDHAYGPIGGLPELREAVAETYNRLYRRGHRSRYGPENVCVAQGGRLALTRAVAALAPGVVGYMLPDYTAYEDLLGMQLARLQTVPLHAAAEEGFRLPPERFARAVAEFGLGAFLLSNPTNPTGALLEGAELRSWVECARARGVALLLDEFYSHFIYAPGGAPAKAPVSAAAFVEDVNSDPVVIFDGLTKNHRYPGWRVGWAIGPRDVVETMSRVGSAIDGGPSRVAQRIALEALEPARADQETTAVRRVFAGKRRQMLERLAALGVRFPVEPRGTFYCFGSLEDLPPPFDDASVFFRRALERQVLTVPGPFFDVNPGRLRAGPSPYARWMRFSFGPPEPNMLQGLARLEEMVRSGA